MVQMNFNMKKWQLVDEKSEKGPFLWSKVSPTHDHLTNYFHKKETRKINLLDCKIRAILYRSTDINLEWRRLQLLFFSAYT
jgi:hypothetical protein